MMIEYDVSCWKIPWFSVSFDEFNLINDSNIYLWFLLGVSSVVRIWSSRSGWVPVDRAHQSDIAQKDYSRMHANPSSFIPSLCLHFEFNVYGIGTSIEHR